MEQVKTIENLKVYIKYKKEQAFMKWEKLEQLLETEKDKYSEESRGAMDNWSSYNKGKYDILFTLECLLERGGL